MTKRIVVIGGGPGGYVSAIRAAQLGAEVTVIEKENLGGTCLNVGCIPTKVLLHTVEIYNILKSPKNLGLEVEGAKVNWSALMKRKNNIVKRLVTGVNGLFKANGVKLVQGAASFVDKNTVKVVNDQEEQLITADYFVVASGSVPFIPPIEGVTLPGVINSTEALSLDAVPESMVIIGGGVIGVEFATVFAGLGCKVSIVEMMPQILPNMDEELVAVLRKSLEKKGIKIYTGAKVTQISENNGLDVKVIHNDKELILNSKNVLVSVGRKIFTDGLELENIGVQYDRKGIKVNKRLQTNVDNIYAIGDCTGENMLAHVASAQGVTAAENIMDIDAVIDYKTVPGCIYTHPEMASVGLTEKAALEKGYDIKVGRFPLIANGKSLIMDEKEGVIKIIVDKKYDEILGMHILGPRATDLIVEGALALRLEATLEEIITTIHAHPTVGEGILEAALAADNIAIHIPNK